MITIESFTHLCINGKHNMESVRQPEVDHHERNQVFNLDAMSTEQILCLNQALWNVFEETVRAPKGENDTTVQDSLIDMLRGAIQDLPSRDLDRGRDLLKTLAISEDPHDREMAAECAPGFADYDLELACDVVVQLQGDYDIGDASNICLWKLTERLTSEQAAELERQAQQRRDER